MPMSASRISPLRGSTWLGPMAPKVGDALVIQRIEARPKSRVSKSASSGWTSTRIASLKPIRSNALFHSSTPAVMVARYLYGHAAVDPVDDRLDRLRERGRRVLLLEAPAVDEALARRALQVVAEVEAAALEVADAAGRPCGRASARRAGGPASSAWSGTGCADRAPSAAPTAAARSAACPASPPRSIRSRSAPAPRAPPGRRWRAPR